MAFNAQFTEHYRLPYFDDGHAYSAQADLQRFVTLDRNLESYLGIVGVGVINGWSLSYSDLTVSPTWGDGFINGYYSESGWVVKHRDDVTPSDIVISEEYYVDDDTGDIYDKIFNQQSLIVPDNADVYVYAYRNSNYSITTPFLEPNNDSPIAETTLNINTSRTAVGFDYATSLSQARSSGRVFLGLVSARNGAIVEVDSSNVNSLLNFQDAIEKYGKLALEVHKHGGNGAFDPPAIRLQTDRRSMILSNNSNAQIEFTAKNSEKTTVEEDHDHTYYIDSNGDGITVDVIGGVPFHFHYISDFVIGNIQGSEGDINSHIHEVNLPSEQDDGWSQSDPVQIYINGEAYDGANATINATDKTVTFVGDVTVKFKKYGINHNGFIFESEEKSLYRFMLRAALAYGQANIGSSNIILPDPATPITPLKNQALVGESRLINRQDTFTFVDVAADNVTVTLQEESHVDSVEIEILLNSEVQGRLPAGNILYIPASSITTGTFKPEVIPMLSHLGRFLESSEPRTNRAKSEDGRVFDITRSDLIGNAQIVHSAIDDGAGTYMIGTSNGLYRKPLAGAYYFVMNGQHIVTTPGDMRTRMEAAALVYQSKTGYPLVINSTYDDQISSAEAAFSAVGDYYKFIGNRNEDQNSGFDIIWLFFLSSYKITDFGYLAKRFENEIKPDEEIIRIIPPEGEVDPDNPPPTEYLVSNNFHKFTVKEIYSEQNLMSGYDGSTTSKYYALSSNNVFTSADADREWNILDESGVDGYLYDIDRSYSSTTAIATTSGVRISRKSSARAFRKMKLPSFDAEVRSIAMGYGDAILISIKGSVSKTIDYGNTWATSSLSSYDIIKIFHDQSLDNTSVDSGHSHTMFINTQGDGETSIVSGHYHTVSKGVIGTSSGHTHTPIRTFYAIDNGGFIYISDDDGESWSSYGRVPTEYTEFGIVFAAFGKVFVALDGKTIMTSDGSTWEDLLVFGGIIYSANLSFNGEDILIGGLNSLYSYDGTDATLIYEATGKPIPLVYLNGVQKKLSFILNNESNSVDMGGPLYLTEKVDVIDDFSNFYPEQDGWKDGIEYDLYFNDRLLKSTRKNVDRSGDMYVNVDNSSVINFSVSSSLLSDIKVGDTQINVVSTNNFPSLGTIKATIAKTGNQEYDRTFFYDYYAKTSTALLLSIPSLYDIDQVDGSAISLVPDIDGNDVVKITVYDGKLTNVGINTHSDIEDALSMEEIGLGKRLSDVYLSNLLHLTIAAQYAIPGVDSDFQNTFISLFDYNFIPGDENNIDRFIDRENSNLASLSLYSVDNLKITASSIRSAAFGFGVYSGYCFAASNIGFYYSNVADHLESDWIRIDIDGNSQAFDVIQHSNDVILVSTENGLYRNSSGSINGEWVQYNSDVIGGIPDRISPRWTTLIDEESGIDYWWGDWDGNVNTNEDLVNTIVVSGENFISISNDRGITWFDGKIYNKANIRIETFYPASYRLLRNGSFVSCINSISGSGSGLYLTTGTGLSWREMYFVNESVGVIKSMSITENLNTKLRVEYSSGQPADSSLIGRNLVIDNLSYRVVSNFENDIVLFGESAINSTSPNFTVLSPRFNILHEDSEKRVMLGGSTGILTDNGGFFSQDRKRDGRIVSLGNRATISSIDISGSVSASFDLSGVIVIEAILDRRVSSNELKDMTINFVSNIPNLIIKSNDVSRPDGTVRITADGDGSNIQANYRFVIRGEGVRLYVSYIGLIGNNDLRNGTLISSPIGSDVGLLRENIAIFKVLSNTESYIDLSSEIEAPEGFDPYESLTVGSDILVSNADGTVPVFVEFDTQIKRNELRGNTIQTRGDGSLPTSGEIDVVSNNEVTILLNETYEASSTSEDGTATSGTYSVLNTLSDGIDFFFSGVPFSPLKSFNDKKSSVLNGHFHETEMLPGPITGDITSFSSVTSSSIKINLENMVNLDDSFLIANPTLLAGEELLAYDPNNIEISYRLKVISTTLNSITVSRKPNALDISGTDSKKVGIGYSIILVTTGYGRTVSTKYNSNYKISYLSIASDVFIGATTIGVSSISGLLENTPVIVSDDNGLSFSTTIESLTAPDTITLKDELPYDYKVENGSKLEFKYANVLIEDSLLSLDASEDDTIIYLDSISDVLPGDTIEIYDNSGTRETGTVLGVGINYVTLVSGIYGNYSISSDATSSFYRENGGDAHEHIIRAGEFSLVRNQARYKLDDPLDHGHYLAPYLEEVSDIKSVNGTIYAVGTFYEVYASNDNGETWEVDFDLSVNSEFTPLPSIVDGIYSNSEDIMLSTTSGYFAYKSPKYTNKST